MKSLSVLMSIYNKENPIYLDKAIRSIWHDQILKPKEIILIEDGPLNDSLNKIIDNYIDEIPLKIIKLDKNVGLSSALNIGLKHCSCDYVARMDTDDISDSKRFEKQMKFFYENPSTDILGCFAKKIDENDKEVGSLSVPTSHNEIKKLIWTCPIIHPTVMFKKSSIIKAGSYNPDAGLRQDDYELWFRCIYKNLQFNNLPEYLFKYRFINDNVKRN